MTAKFFKTPADFRHWLDRHHAAETALLVGFHKVGSGKPSMTWPESVDEALCVGWIDGVRRSLGTDAYTIRFSPRRTGSIWSAINIRKAEALIAEGRMRPAGLQAFEARTSDKSMIYAYEQRSAEMPEQYARVMKKNKQAWSFFSAQPPGYRKRMCWWIASAKQEATRLSRLEKLIAASTAGQRL